MSDIESTGTAAASGGSFRLSDEQRELRQVAHEFAARELRPIAREWDERSDFPPDLSRKAAQLGLTSYAVLREHDGSGVDAPAAALIVEELSRRDIVAAYLEQAWTEKPH
jgi:alkylation response protein AidB-like acyl-CoA dehydrogenase